jgi:TfoX/Sxy family transcriptional regulator of competence genes
MIFFYTTKKHKIMQVSGISTLLSVVSEKNMMGKYGLLDSGV